jgi:Peptidase inhibitor family I36
MPTNTTRRLSLIAMAGASAGLATVLVPTAAHAAPPGCAAGALCVYDQENYDGTRYQFFGTNSSWAPYGIEDRNASWFNNGTTGRWARIWELRSCAGGWGTYSSVSPGTGVADGSQYYVYKRSSSNDWPWGPFDPAGC